MPWHLILRRLLLKMSKRSLNRNNSNLQLQIAILSFFTSKGAGQYLQEEWSWWKGYH